MKDLRSCALFVRKNGKAVAANVAVCALTVALVLAPRKCIASVYSGLTMFALNVLPSLFPFFFFTRLLTSLGAAKVLGKLFRRPVAALYNAPPIGGYIYLISVLSGYPVGARLLADLYKVGAIDGADARCICTFTSTSGPLFVVGTVGTMMFGDPLLGYIAMCCHALGALLNGLIFRRRKPPSRRRAFVPACTDDVLGSGMLDSILSIAVVGGYIAVFGMIIDLALACGVVDTLAAPLGALLSAIGQDGAAARPLVIGAIELTRGCSALADLGLQTKTALPYLTGMLSLGGMSIAFQSLAFCAKCEIGIGYFALSKLTQAAITIAVSIAVAALM